MGSEASVVTCGAASLQAPTLPGNLLRAHSQLLPCPPPRHLLCPGAGHRIHQRLPGCRARHPHAAVCLHGPRRLRVGHRTLSGGGHTAGGWVGAWVRGCVGGSVSPGSAPATAAQPSGRQLGRRVAGVAAGRTTSHPSQSPGALMLLPPMHTRCCAGAQGPLSHAAQRIQQDCGAELPGRHLAAWLWWPAGR
jgi:hypothetical protein